MSDTSSQSALSRRSLLTGLLATPALAATVQPGTAQADGPRWTPQQAQAALKDANGTKLVLLGTAAGPVPGRSREMTSHVMLSNGAAYVLDCGIGVTNQYARTGIPFNALKSIFVTHHHADHNIEYGPISAAGRVTQDENVKVSAILVEHPPVKPALGYRFDFKDRSIAFSGDTAPLEAVAEMAKGMDVLVHETMYVPAVETYIRDMIAQGRPVKFDTFMAHMKADHTPSEDVGRIAQEAGVKTLVLSHLTPAIDSIDDETWRAPVAKYFKGEIIVGKDLMVV